MPSHLPLPLLHSYDNEYFYFVRHLVASATLATVSEYPEGGVTSESDALAKGGTRMNVVQLAVQFVLGTLARADDKSSVKDWMLTVQQHQPPLLPSIANHCSSLPTAPRRVR